ncbi:MAG: site-specific DNA-methyltransferase, partial [Candidatus Hinthialibacter sp.]
MSQQLEKLKRLLRELFQLDQSDLDFGLYRIMNQKREEIESFLSDDLTPQVKAVLQEYQRGEFLQWKEELEKKVQSAKEMGLNPDQVPSIQQLKAQIEQGTDIQALESQVYSDLYNFFRRYYSNGDFLSLRRYKDGVYAIPYEGEEVKLYWANYDQYYIKSSEHLRNYSFKLADQRRVHFKVVDAGSEADNKKAVNGNERRFILSDDVPLMEQNGELYIRFTYLPDPEKRKQADLNQAAVQTVLQADGFGEWTSALAELKPTEKNANRTLLEKHLNDFTARNTFDYFIHKDLGGFLRRELDFYIKNEIMHLDDIENESAPKVERYLAKIRAMRRIGGKIILFLEQLENFQKRLWLKKKFVVETNYCITLDRIPKELYPVIAENNAQWEEWEKLNFIDDSIDLDPLKEEHSEKINTGETLLWDQEELHASGLITTGC